MRPDAPAERERVILAGAAQQALVAVAVARILPGGRGAREPGLALVAPGGLHALDARARDVAVLAVEGGEIGDDVLDQVVDVIAKCRQGQLVALADAVAQRDLDALRRLRLEIRVAAEAVAVGGVRRTKRRAGGEGNRRRAGQGEPILEVPGCFAAEILVMRVADAGQQAVPAGRVLVLHVGQLHAGALVEAEAEGLGGGVLVLQQHACGDHVSVPDGNVVLPVELPAPSPEVVRRLVLIDAVECVAERHARVPARPRAAGGLEREGRVLEVLVHGRDEEVGVFGGAARVPGARGELDPGQLALRKGVGAQVAVAAVDGVSRAGREARAVEPADAKCAAAVLSAEAGREGGRARVVAAAADLEGGAGRAAGDDVDHPADRVRAVERGARSLHDLDALDHRWRDVLQRRHADGAGVDAHAVHQHQHVVRLGAAQEQRGLLAGPAEADRLDARAEAQRVGDIGAGQARKLLGRDHFDRGEHLGGRRGRARGGHDERLEGR